jgi:MoxR-like ATPase
VDYPSAERELEIVARKVPGIAERLARQVVDFVQSLRGLELFKPPGVAETLDWARALMMLGTAEVTPHAADETLGALLKYQDDIERVRGARTAALLATSAG